MSDTQPAVQSSSGGESVRQIVTAMQLLQSQKSSGDVFWDPKTNEPMGGKFSHHLGELLPRCSSPVGDDGFPEVNLETTPGIDGDDASGHKRVCIRRSGKCFETLAHAAQEVLPGDEIVLSSGMFYETEDVILDKDNVTISAAKEGEILASVRIIFSADCCLICEGSGVLVSNVTFLQLRNWNRETKSKETARAQGCIRIRDGNAQFKQCSFSSESAPAIVVSGSAHPMIEGSSISGCKKVAILCQGNSYPTFESNKIQNNMGFAISVHDESAAQFLNNTVSNTVKCAVICGGSSTALFQGNTVSDGTQGGFWIQGRSKCVLKDNIIRNNHKAALQISDHSDPHIEGNQILDGDGGGIVVHGNAKGLYIQNKLSGSVRAGIGGRGGDGRELCTDLHREQAAAERVRGAGRQGALDAAAAGQHHRWQRGVRHPVAGQEPDRGPGLHGGEQPASRAVRVRGGGAACEQVPDPGEHGGAAAGGAADARRLEGDHGEVHSPGAQDWERGDAGP
eukprot:2156237-Rhodomonas_salina.1